MDYENSPMKSSYSDPRLFGRAADAKAWTNATLSPTESRICETIDLARRLAERLEVSNNRLDGALTAFAGHQPQKTEGPDAAVAPDGYLYTLNVLLGRIERAVAEGETLASRAVELIG